MNDKCAYTLDGGKKKKFKETDRTEDIITDAKIVLKLKSKHMACFVGFNFCDSVNQYTVIFNTVG
jgi:hypothetical protein